MQHLSCLESHGKICFDASQKQSIINADTAKWVSFQNGSEAVMW